MNSIIEQLTENLIKNKVASPKNIRGCSELEINELESYFNVKLPQLYKEFLKKMGKQAGDYRVGTDIFYEDLYDLRQQFQDILDDHNNPFLLKPSIFVFSVHQGVIFHFFDTGDDYTDPPVYGYLEGEKNVKLIYEKYSKYLMCENYKN